MWLVNFQLSRRTPEDKSLREVLQGLPLLPAAPFPPRPILPPSSGASSATNTRLPTSHYTSRLASIIHEPHVGEANQKKGRCVGATHAPGENDSSGFHSFPARYGRTCLPKGPPENQSNSIKSIKLSLVKGLA